ncbi:hypothetical protein ABKN59_009431 [Abortiporus biennis]
MVPKSFTLLAFLLPIVSVQAGNDWNTPCLSGKCTYFSKQSGPAAGRVDIVGSSNAISDITPAAGWTILNCDSEAEAQDIRLVCTGSKAACNHVFSGTGGAVGTVVRLPESCGKMPFARIAKAYDHNDQSLPSSVASQFSGRRVAPPVIKGLRIDTNFAAVDPATNGNITVIVQGSSAGVNNGVVYVNSTSSGDLSSRGLFDWFEDLIDDLTFNLTKTLGTINESYDKSLTLLDQSISCPSLGGSASINVGVHAQASTNINYGFVAAGSIVPPEIDQFGLVAVLNGQADGVLTVNAGVTGSLDSGTHSIFSATLPGISIAGILDLAPTFEVDVQASANLDAAVNLNVDLSYTITNAQLHFPPVYGQNGGIFSPGDNELLLSATPNVNANGVATAHIIPSVKFGLNALGGIASANVNLDVDASATLDLSLTASGSASAGTGTDGSSAGASASFNGCVDIETGLNVGAGADADLFGLWNPSTSVTLFQKTWDLYDKCFSGSASTKRSQIERRALIESGLVKRGLSCPIAAQVATVAPVVNAKIAGSTIQ